MDDEFLYQYWRHPRPAFARALYGRISSQPVVSVSFVPMRKLVRNAVLMGVALVVMLACSPLWSEEALEHKRHA